MLATHVHSVRSCVCRVGYFIPLISYRPAMYLFEASRALRGQATRYGPFLLDVGGAGFEPAASPPDGGALCPG